MPPDHQDILTDLRLAVARLEVKVTGIDEKMDTALVSREHFEERLAPLTESLNRWRGGMAAITLIAGSVGALVTSFLKHLIGGQP